MIQPTFAICLVLLCTTAAWAQLHCAGEEQLLYSMTPRRSEKIDGIFVEEMRPFPSYSSKSCSDQGRLMVNLPATADPKKMLKVKFTLAEPKSLSGRTFIIGDRRDNAGAKVYSNRRNVKVYPSQSNADQLQISDREVTMIIGRRAVWLKEGITPKQSPYTDLDLFAEDESHLFVGLNRDIEDNSVRGEGLCNVKIYVLECEV